MSGIVGLWNLDGRPLEPSVLDGMSRTLRHRGPDGEGRCIDGSSGFVHQHAWVTPEEVGEQQPLVGRTDAVLVLDGRIDNRDELLRALDLPRTASDAGCVLAAYERWGDAFAERLNGDFALAVFDESRQRLILARDAIGIRPLYYFRNERLFAFASEIKALLAHPDIPSQPDDEGIADFLLMSSRPLDQQAATCFAGISAVEPAHLVIATPGRAAARRYWDFDAGLAIRLRSFAEYTEAFQERFSTAITRRIRSAYPIAVSVSGGLDSSSIFCEAETLVRSGAGACPGIKGVAYSGFAGTDSDEVAFLREIEREYGVSIDRFPLEQFSGLASGVHEQIGAIEAPFLDYMWGVTRELHRRARATGARVLLSGTWGDQVLFSSAYLIDLFRRLAWGKILHDLREYRRWFGEEEARILTRSFAWATARHHLPPALVPPLKRIRLKWFPPGRPKRWFSDAFLGRALRFADRPATMGAGFHSAQARSIYLEARSKYHVHCMEWNNKVTALSGLDAALPFLDRDLIAFLMAIPGEIQNWRGVPRGLMREAMRGILPEPVRTRAWKANFTNAVNRGVEQDLSAITHALSRDSLGVRRGYLDPERLAPEVAALSASLSEADTSYSWDLADVFGLEVWLQVFFQGGAKVAGSRSAQQEGR
jgi:asparagine synthase (glutamine-hydrolysing)